MTITTGQGQGLFEFALPSVNWDCPIIKKLPMFANAKRIAIDVETRDEKLKELGPGCRRDRRSNYLVGVAISIEDGEKFYLPLRHEGGGNCDLEAGLSYLRDQFHDFHGTVTGANLGYDLDWLATDNIVFKLDPVIEDVQTADPLINELHNSYSLESICNRYDLPGKDETALREAAKAMRVDPKSQLWKLHAKYVAKYAIHDADVCHAIRRRQDVLIEREEISRIWHLERQVTPILVKMRQRGVRIDMGALSSLESDAMTIELDMCRKVKTLTGVSISPDDLWNARALAAPIRAAGYRVDKTSRNQQDSVDKALLDRSGEVGAAIKRAREWNRLRTTFARQIRDHAIHHGGDHYRVHCTFNQLRATSDDGDSKGVRYGRLSSSDFNIQQQPVRHKEFGDRWRCIFVADKDAQWACSDWSQQEPRIAVDCAEKLGLPGAKEFGDQYRANPALDIHQKLADLSGLERVIVKNFVNGRLYAMGDSKLCRAIGRPTITVERRINGEMREVEVPGPEGQEIIDQFNKFAPWIKGLTTSASAIARTRGHIWTILRRKCHFPIDPATGEIYKSWLHKAFNRYGQGSAADQAKATLIEADKQGIPIQLAVHDEFDFSWTDIKQCLLLKELQLNVVKFTVPMKVDLEIGSSWGKLEKYAA